MKKIRKTAATIAVMLAAISMLGGCLDEDYEDYEYSDEDGEEYEEGYEEAYEEAPAEEAPTEDGQE